jgi:hypothetical protein
MMSDVSIFLSKEVTRMLKKRFSVLFIPCVLLALLVVLAALLMFKDGEPQADYSVHIKEAQTSKEGIHGFVVTEPSGLLHVADVFSLEVGVVYDIRKWEVSTDVFDSISFLPGQFEIRDRVEGTYQDGSYAVIVSTVRYQCLECRDGKYSVTFGTQISPLARIKDTDDVRAIPFADVQDRSIKYAPLTDDEFKIDEDLASLTIKKQGQWRLPVFAFSFLSMIITSGYLWYVYFRMHPEGNVPSTQTNIQELLHARIKELHQELEKEDPIEIAHKFSILISLLIQEAPDSVGMGLSGIVKDIDRAYSVEGITKEALQNAMKKFEDVLAMQGEE